MIDLKSNHVGNLVVVVFSHLFRGYSLGVTLDLKPYYSPFTWCSKDS